LVARLPTVVGRRDVVAALGAIADPRAVPALTQRLQEDEYVPVRAEAAAALANIGGAEAKAALGKAARSEREPVVKAAVRDALGRLR
jgi:HEAT repeat protein